MQDPEQGREKRAWPQASTQMWTRSQMWTWRCLPGAPGAWGTCPRGRRPAAHPATPGVFPVRHAQGAQRSERPPRPAPL